MIENHDEPRGASHYLPLGFEEQPRAQKALAAVTLLLRGLPFLYQGQELGMTNKPFASIHEVDDVNTKGEYAACLAAGLRADDALEVIAHYSRDNARTPVQWSAQANAGFTAGTPWMPVNLRYRSVNAEAQQADPASVLNFYKKLISLRKDPAYKETLVWGDFEPLYTEREGLAAFWRRADKKLLVLSNLSDEAMLLPLPGPVRAVVLNSRQLPPELEQQALILAPWQALVLEME